MPEPQTCHFIAVLLYPGCSLLDVAAPIETLAAGHYRLTTVAARMRPVAASGALRLLAERTFDELPRPAVLIVPGGGATAVAALADRELVDYVRQAGTRAAIAASIGTGTLLLAAAGILQGRAAAAPAGIAGSYAGHGARYLAQAIVEDGPTLTAAGSFAAPALASALAARLAPTAGDPR